MVLLYRLSNVINSTEALLVCSDCKPTVIKLISYNAHCLLTRRNMSVIAQRRRPAHCPQYTTRHRREYHSSSAQPITVFSAAVLIGSFNPKSRRLKFVSGTTPASVIVL